MSGKGQAAVIIPTSHDAADARESLAHFKRLAPSLAESNDMEFFVQGQELDEKLTIPPIAMRLLYDILHQIGKGNAISLIPYHRQLTTQAAADLLNVSRPYLVKLLESGDIPFQKVGTHRRVHLDELLAYKKKLEQDRLEALDALSAQAQDLNMGY